MKTGAQRHGERRFRPYQRIFGYHATSKTSSASVERDAIAVIEGFLRIAVFAVVRIAVVAMDRSPFLTIV